MGLQGKLIRGISLWEEKKKDYIFQFIKKICGKKITQQPRVTTAKISFFFYYKRNRNAMGDLQI